MSNIFFIFSQVLCQLFFTCMTNLKSFVMTSRIYNKEIEFAKVIFHGLHQLLLNSKNFAEKETFFRNTSGIVNHLKLLITT